MSDGFNEAPAISPGNSSAARSDAVSGTCFNEAPAISPGNEEADALLYEQLGCFNEAPAISPGNTDKAKTRKLTLTLLQ